jgi:cephalosporin hydroxylase
MITPLVLCEMLPCGCFLSPLGQDDPGDGVLIHQKDHDILETYNRLFNELLPLFVPNRIMEIGVNRGGSLAMWRHRFHCEVLGIDTVDNVSPAMKTHLHHVDRILLTQADATDSGLMSRFDNRAPSLDLIIDDGSHRFSDILSAFRILWGHVRTGGLYVIEDWRSDEGDYPELSRWLLGQLVGHWPSKGLPTDAPKCIHYFRDLIVLEKQ